MIAKCSSFKCSGQKGGSPAKAAVKDVPKSATNCPDCGYVLRWAKGEREAIHTANKSKQKPDRVSRKEFL